MKFFNQFNPEKSADQQRYKVLVKECDAWDDQLYDPNNHRNEEMSRKAEERIALFYKLNPEERGTPIEGVEINFYDFPM